MKRIGMFLLAVVMVLGAAGCARVKLYTRNASETITMQSLNVTALDVIASCDPGDEVVGGGFEITPPDVMWGSGLVNTASVPTQDNRGWRAHFEVHHMMLPGAVLVKPSAWARCADLTP